MTGTHELGQRIRAARIAAGLTQEQLAHQAGITDRTVRAIEAGTTTPQRRIREGLAQVLGDVSDLHDPEAAMPATGCGSNHDDGAAAVRRSPVVAHPGG